VNSMIDDSKPIFVQIAERIEDDILTEVLPEESQVPSTNQFATYYQINPATAAKGVNMLVDEGILYKKRGIGMFVSTSARKAVLKKRKTQFIQQYVRTMMKEAEKLEISVSELVQMIEQEKGE
jgi:DNA-binding transcriptional regulator YhcF (GntR family)